MNWNREDLNGLVIDIISELKEVGFSGVEDWDTFGDILRYKLKNQVSLICCQKWL